MSEKKILLNAEDIELKIQRLSIEVAEKYLNSKKLFIFGIEGQGSNLAERITKNIQSYINTEIILGEIKIDKKNPIGSVKIDTSILEKIKNHDVLIIDDVLNSGKTLFYSLQLFTNIPLSSLRVLVLVNRSHQCFPVYPDFVGMTLSTTYQNHIEAILSTKKNSSVYLLNK